MKKIDAAWMWLKAPKRRLWEYRVACAGLAVAGTYGLVQGDKLAGVEYLLSALFGQASRNVDTTPPPGD